MASEQLMVSVNIDRDDFDEYQRLGQRWLTELPTLLAPKIWQRMISGDPKAEAAMVIVPRPMGPIRGEDFDYARLQRCIAKLSAPAEGISLSAKVDNQHFRVEVTWKEKSHVRFWCGVPTSRDLIGDQVVRLMDFLTDLLDDADPAFGAASTVDGNRTDTALDDGLRRIYWESIGQAREFLRGYSWLTVVPKELVARLGGVEALQEVPLAAVRPLVSGGAIVLASSTPFYYDDVAMRNLFRTVAPVLPPGKPKRGHLYAGATQLVFEDPRNI